MGGNQSVETEGFNSIKPTKLKLSQCLQHKLKPSPQQHQYNVNKIYKHSNKKRNVISLYKIICKSKMGTLLV